MHHRHRSVMKGQNGAPKALEITPANLPPHGITSQRGEEALNGTADRPEDEVTVPGSVEGDGKAKTGHEEVGHRQVDQDVVERLPELLVFEGDQEGEEVDGQTGGDEEEDVAAHDAVFPGLGQVVLGILERASHHPCLVGHRHVKIDTFRPVHPANGTAVALL